METIHEKLQFCAHYLSTHGITADRYKGMVDKLPGDIPPYRITKMNPEYFTVLAEKLKEMWPAGNKDGKYPWRGSTDMLVQRLITLWSRKGYGEVPVEKCLAAADRYLDQFRNKSVKYMQTLKYFIFKQETVNSDGKLSTVIKSTFADYLDDAVPDNEIEYATSTIHMV